MELVSYPICAFLDSRREENRFLAELWHAFPESNHSPMKFRCLRKDYRRRALLTPNNSIATFLLIADSTAMVTNPHFTQLVNI
jgi:hypothetical protein